MPKLTTLGNIKMRKIIFTMFLALFCSQASAFCIVNDGYPDMNVSYSQDGWLLNHHLIARSYRTTCFNKKLDASKPINLIVGYKRWRSLPKYEFHPFKKPYTVIPIEYSGPTNICLKVDGIHLRMVEIGTSEASDC